MNRLSVLGPLAPFLMILGGVLMMSGGFSQTLNGSPQPLPSLSTGGQSLDIVSFWTLVGAIIAVAGVVIAALHFWELKAIATSQVAEKTAMLYGYAATFMDEEKGHKDRVDIITRKIEADLSALGHVKRFADSGQKTELHKAKEMLVGKMREKRYSQQASEIEATFTSLHI